VRRRGNLLARVQNTHHQYNLDVPAKKVAYEANREGVAKRFAHADVRKSIETDLALVGDYDARIREEREAFFEFTCRVNRVMREHAVLRRRKFFQGRRIRGAEVKDIMWLSPTGEEMTEPEWNAGHAQCLGVRLAGDSMDELDADGNPVSGDTLVYLMNAAAVSIEFVLPAFVKRPRWACLLDTFDASREGAVFDGDYRYPLAERSLAVFRMEPRSAAERRARVSV
jgi:pullulanase/glycogen debranching enzyme